MLDCEKPDVRIRALIALVGFVSFLMLVAFSTTASRLHASPSGKAHRSKLLASTGPHIYLDESRALPVAYVGDPGAIGSIVSEKASPLSMTSGDFDGDGIDDLLIGYGTSQGGVIAFHRGNLDAFAPQSSESFEAIGRGDFPSPFLKEASLLTVPIRPDFIATGHFGLSEHKSLVVAARGGTALYLFSGDGKGSFTNAKAVDLPGGVTALAAGPLGTEEYANLIVGVSGETPALMIFKARKARLYSIGCYPLKAAPSDVTLGDLGDAEQDVVFLSGGEVQVFRPSSGQLQALSLPVSAERFALGSFIFDRKGSTQIGLLTSDGNLHFAVPGEFDPRPFTNDELTTFRRSSLTPRHDALIKRPLFQAKGWRIVETVSVIASPNSREMPVMFRTRISSNAADDVMVLDGSNSQMTVISHPNLVDGAVDFVPGQVSTRPYQGRPVAALPMRINIDGRPGVVAVREGQVAVELLMPLPDPTFFVNRTDDPVPGALASTCNNVSNVDVSSSCSLREAILKANATAGTDTISLAAGTYTLSLSRVNGVYDGKQGTLEILDSVNIVGAGQATTIIQAGTTNTNGVDMLMAVNEDINPKSNATASISNLTMRFGRNRGSVAGTDGDGGCMEFDTGTSGNANLTLTNVTLTDCSTLDGNGAGIATFNITFPGGGTGLATITNSIIQNNSAAEVNLNAAGSGGGVWVSDRARMLMTNTQVLNNNANQINGTGRGVGGGVFIFSAGAGSRQTIIHNSTISGNHASGDGGGIWDTSNLLIDNTGGPTVISGNTAGGNGGGIHYHAVSPDVMTLTKVTITGNTATGNGGGIDTGEPTLAHALTMSFSRLAGNTASLGSNLNNNHSTFTATNNWWGTNSPAGTINNLNSGTTTFDPFIQLIHTASPNKIRINQSTTLTASFLQDNHGTAISASNLDVLLGLPITFNNAVDGSISGAQTTIQSNGTATATFNAGNVAGGGKADAVVDQQTTTANIVVLQPPSITKSFSPTTVKVGSPSTITFSISNPNVVTINASFADDLTSGGTVSGLVVAATPNVVNGCGGSVTATAGSTSISFLNGALPVSASPCTIKVDVTGTSDGVKGNSVTINSTDAGNGNTSSANLKVINPPTINKVFAASTIPLNGTTSLTFTITNPNSNAASVLNGISFTDTLPNSAPGSLVVATPNGLTNTCSTTPTATAGSGSISLSGASLAPGASCTISVNVKGTVAGLAPNSVTVSDTVAGTGNTSSTSLTVVAPPIISKAFNPANSIPLNGTAKLTFTISNPNTTAAGDLTAVAFSDTLPSSTGTLLVASTPNVSNTCNGTATATAGTGVIGFSGGTVAHSASCTLSVDVKGTVAGDAANTTGAITSAEGGTGSTSNTATLKVVAPPSISKAFGAATIAVNGATTLTFTITNPAANTTAENGIAFSDTLTNGLQVASSPGVSSTCNGTVTAAANSTSISLSGGSIATPGNTCTIVVNVTGTQSPLVSNTTGAISSTNGGTGATSNTATLTVCSSSITVTSTADSGAGTLRQAILDACAGATITFDTAGTFSTPQTITLTSGELAINKNLTIKAPGLAANAVTISGNNASRVFNVNNGSSLTVIGLTISGGQNAGFGGGILNDGTLTVVNSTLTSNHSDTEGGAITTDAAATSLTLINTTISGNNSNGNGGGVSVLGGTMTSINSTITNNKADNDNNSAGTGGGISASAGTTTLKNTIVAGNFNEDGVTDSADDISGTVDAASSFNLIGTGGAGGLTNGVNSNQVGVANPGLGVLASNGGPTQTHALLLGSPAIEAGGNANLPADTFDLDGDANVAEPLPVDQRGPAFPRVADSADANLIQTVDIGAYEAHPTIEDIGNQTTSESTNKDVTFKLGDDTGTLITGPGGSVQATSSNTTLVPNANLSFINPTTGTRTLHIVPTTNQNGTTTITVTVTATNGRTATDTFDLNVSSVNNPPVGTDNTVSTAEDNFYTFTAADFGFTDPNDNPPNNFLAVKITTLPGLGTLTNNNVPVNAGDFIPVANINPGLLKFTPASNGNGTPYTSFTFQVQDDGGGSDLDPTPNTMTINVTAVNDAPVNTVPGPQTTNQDTPKMFSSGNSNQISVADVDAGSNPVKITLTATNGTITLSTIAGLSFTTGDGTADATMVFTGTLTSVNTALNGMSFNPTSGFNGAASLQIVSDDQGNTGTGGPQTDTDSVNIQVSTNVSIQDAQTVEPSSGSVNMIFTLTLSAPAPAGGASVNFTTQDQAPAINHATAGQDYTATSGTVNFAAGEQIKSIPVPILADNAKNEQNETFLVVLSNPVNTQISDGTATGTILITNQAGTILISELRTSGPAGAGDDFVEIYNNSDTPHTVSASDGSGGYGLFKMGADCSTAPVLVGVIPNGTVIPGRGHYLFVGSAYSLAAAAAGDQTLSSDIESDHNVAIFSTASLPAISSANRFDAVGFGSNTGGICDLFREGTTLTPLSGSVLEYSYFRDECGNKGNPATFGPCPTNGFMADTNNNNNDFIFADTQGTVTPAGQRLGTPGPQNLGSPRLNLLISALLLDATKGSTAAPNRVRDMTPQLPNAMNGTLSIRRRFVNSTGANVTRLRFRIVDISALASAGGVADLRALTSPASITVTGISDSGTCSSTGTPATTPCAVTVFGTTLETPPNQLLGGALNGSLNAGTITLPTPLAPGQSINLQFLLGVQQAGSFKFFVNIEALP